MTNFGMFYELEVRGRTREVEQQAFENVLSQPAAHARRPQAFRG